MTEPHSNDNSDQADDIGTVIAGTTGVAALVVAALLVGAVPFAVSLLGVGLLPYPGGVRELGTGDLLLRAGATFLIFAAAGVPAGLVGKTVTIWKTLRSGRSSKSSESYKKSARNAGRATSLVMTGAVLAVLLSAWLTVSVSGAVIVALLTVTLEYLLEPVVDRYVTK